MLWDNIKAHVKGIGVRIWFMHHTKLKTFNMNSLRLKLITQQAIDRAKKQNTIVSLYEGTLNESVEPCHDPLPQMLSFGRSLYCNFTSSYYVGHTVGPL